MAIPILHTWKQYYGNPHEGLGSSYERIILNRKLLQLQSKYKFSTVLEVPSFGFTGLSGINSVALAKKGCAVTLGDHDQERIDLIRKTWADLNLPLQIDYLEQYGKLPYADQQFEMSWNFSALWFAESLSDFLHELTRVTSRLILLCVPNRSGIGYLSQKYQGREELDKYLKECNILPDNILHEMDELGWKCIDRAYIDCPPWPDIGMLKEEFLGKIGIKIEKKEKEVQEVTILNYYKGLDPEFEDKMLSFSILENYAPVFWKRIWAHHRYFLFVPRVNHE
ncbi:MAG TPA: methyltransferase domain-containing protein [Candidatus Cloacimonadota bacterium]|nr:methyltransferase domain-containing protein [Candidatus Cloacimonadota bacterium]HPT71849.1 methyltransferase domain-containing protein [Candidatus Cloacimonadota bacterium]